MRYVLALLLLCLASTFACAEGFADASLVREGERLLITTSDRGRFEAPALPDQVGFDSPKISPDGRYVGWLALFPSCCTSYPIPGKLVVLSKDRQLRTFDGINLAVFRWCFVPNSASVAYMQTQLHGTNYQHFEHRSIADDRLLGKYDYPHEDAANVGARKHAPAWVRCVPE